MAHHGALESLPRKPTEESSQYEELLEFLRLSSDEELRTFLFDQFRLRLLQTYLTKSNGTEDFPLNAIVIDTVLGKVVEDFSGLLNTQANELGLFLKRKLTPGPISLSKSEFIEAITNLASSDFSKREVGQCSVSHLAGDLELVVRQQKQLEELKLSFQETKQEVAQAHSGWVEELGRLEHHFKGREVAASSYHKVLEENRMLYNQVQDLKEHLEVAASSYHKVLEENRMLYDQAQDLKGTIRVYCRVRPFLPGQSNEQSSVDYIGENGNIMIVNPYKHGRDARVFTFNKILGTNVTQEQIYADTQPLIRSVLDGYNVCIFAYGETGTGKTYTMSGPDVTTEETWGVNYRALRDLFHTSNARMDFIEYEVSVQMIEIYNEQVRDLLVSDGNSRRLAIRNNSQLNGLNVPDARLAPVTCSQDVLELTRIGQMNRAVGATALNELRSCSHSVLTVHVQGRELASGSVLRGCLHLVDLAGSERVNKSEAVGERLKEAQNINRSLSALGDVIHALAQKSTHIPYRNSKLTQVLQNSLGGRSKILMFVHINPETNATEETVSTLKFAERVASIELGAARSNKETGEIRDLKEEISNLKLALEKKEGELNQAKGGNTRGPVDSQKARAPSPFNMPRYGTAPSLKPGTSQRSVEPRSCFSGKHSRSRFSSACKGKDIIPKMPFLAEEKPMSFGKARSPSTPIRGSISTDRGSP